MPLPVSNGLSANLGLLIGPPGPQGPPGAVTGSAGGDLGGSYPNPNVLKINGTTVPTTSAPDVGKALTVTGAGAAAWQTATGFTAGGDLSGSNTNQTVIKINGTTIPVTAGGDVGKALVVTGAGSATWQTVSGGGADATVWAYDGTGQATINVSGKTYATIGTEETSTHPEFDINLIGSTPTTHGRVNISENNANPFVDIFAGDDSFPYAEIKVQKFGATRGSIDMISSGGINGYIQMGFYGIGDTPRDAATSYMYMGYIGGFSTSVSGIEVNKMGMWTVPYTQNSSAAFGFPNADGAQSNFHRFILDQASTTIGAVNMANGQMVAIEIVQDATGGRTVSFASIFNFGPLSHTVSSGANSHTMLLGFYNSSTGKINVIVFSAGY